MIDRLVIDRLEATPIEGVAERLGLQVERHKCLCPFHDDSRPSLTFNTYRNRYRCYVCDAHGGVIDLVRNYKGVGFRDACSWLDGSAVLGASSFIGAELGSVSRSPSSNGTPSPSCAAPSAVPTARRYNAPSGRSITPDLDWLSALVRTKVLTLEARRFLFEERKIDPRVVAWCGLTSISEAQPCWRYGKPFYDAPSLLIPYYDADGRLVSVQSRYLGKDGLPRFRFPRGSDCHIYGLQILRMLKPGEELWITEGASDCWAMLSSGKKAIAIPSATLLKEKDIEPLRGLNLHMYPDQDRPGEKLFLELRERLPQLQRHQLPQGYKDFGAYYAQVMNAKNE